MNTKRKLEVKYTPPAQSGFLGKGHIAIPVVQVDFSESDPFIMLMDDQLDKKDNDPVGGPHPHAGFETVSLVIEGEIGEEPHVMKAGDFEMMTAGSGIVHTEIISKQMKMRLMQLWLNLPKSDRNAQPRVQKLKSEHAPTTSSNGVTTKVYSGTFAGVTSPVKNYTPLTIADVSIESDRKTVQIIPSDYTTFIYVLSGSVRIGEEAKLLSQGEVGWLDRPEQGGDSDLILSTGSDAVHFLLYSAKPQHHEIVSHGPFIADSMDKIKELYADFRHGKMEHITEVTEEQKFVY